MVNAKSPDWEAVAGADFGAAYSASEFERAFRLYLSAIVRRAHSLIQGEGLILDWNRPPESFAEYAGGIAAALDRLIEQAGDDASHRLIVAREVTAAAAAFQIVLSRSRDSDEMTADDFAEVLLQTIHLGNVEVQLSQTTSGFIDDYANLKWGQQLDRERRQRAAKSTKAAKQKKHARVLELARQIVATNPTLSHDDLAFMLKKRESLTEAIRTITGWVREWRKTGELRPISNAEQNGAETLSDL